MLGNCPLVQIVGTDQYDQRMREAKDKTRRQDADHPFATAEMTRDAIKAVTNPGLDQIWIDEFSVPETKERADLVSVGTRLDAYEIKTERDDLRRLPRQVAAFSRLFDRCTIVTAEKHLDGCLDLVPEWWAVSTTSLGPSGAHLDHIRKGTGNPDPDAAVMVRLLWKREVAEAVKEIAAPSPPEASRQMLWDALLKHGRPAEVRRLVRDALYCRDGASARLPSRRFNVGRPVVDP